MDPEKIYEASKKCDRIAGHIFPLYGDEGQAKAFLFILACRNLLSAEMTFAYELKSVLADNRAQAQEERNGTD